MSIVTFEPAAGPRRVTKLAFRLRFTAAERAAIELAAVDNPAAGDAARAAAAALRADLANQRDARYIDLDLTETRAGVQQLEAVGLLGSGRAAQVLDAPVLAHEAFKE